MKTIFILDRLMLYFQVDTQAQLAVKLGISTTTLSNWKARNTIDYPLIFTKCESINADWLIHGRGEMLVGGKKYADLSENTHLNMVAEHCTPANSDLVAYLERKLDEKTREVYDLQAKIEGLACELRRRKEAPAEEHPLANVG